MRVRECAAPRRHLLRVRTPARPRAVVSRRGTLALPALSPAALGPMRVACVIGLRRAHFPSMFPVATRKSARARSCLTPLSLRPVEAYAVVLTD